MAVDITLINHGTVPDDHTGEHPFYAFEKANENFTNLKAAADLVLDVPQNYLLGRVTASTGDTEQLTATQVRTILNVEDGATGDMTAGQIEAIVSHDNLLNYVVSEHIDWSVTGPEVVHADRYTAGGTEVNDLTASVTWDDVPNANITEGSVTQHEGAIDHNALTGFVANEHLDWTADQGATNIHAGNYIDTTYVSSDFTHDDLTGFVSNEHIDWSVTGPEVVHADRYTSSGAEVNDLTASVTWDDVPNTNITESSVTQHEGAIDHDALANFVANEHLDWTSDQGATNIHAGNYTDTTYVSSDFTHDDLTGFVENEHIDWTSDQGATNIHSGNYTDTTYVASDFNHDDLSAVSANEHIDWTNATASLSTTGSLAGSNFTGSSSGSNTGDQTDMSSISDTKANFNTALSDGTFMFTGDAPTAHTHLLAAGATDVTATAAELNVLDLSGTALTAGWVYKATGVSTAAWGQLSGSELNNDQNWAADQTSIAGITGTKAQFDTACTDGDFSYDGHTHTFASLTSKPTTLSGYGISDTIANFNSALSDGSFATGGGTATGSNTGDQTITLTGDVTGGGTGSFATAIANNVIGLPELTHQTAGQIIYYGASGVPALLTAGSNTQVLTLTSGLPAWEDAGGGSGDNDLDSSPSTDHTATGFTADFTAAESLVFGNLCYLDSSGEMGKCDADLETSMPAAAICLETISASSSGSFLLYGIIRDDSWAWSVGTTLYASVTAGALTATAPSGSGDVVQVVGHAVSADIVMFRPSPDTILVA